MQTNVSSTTQTNCRSASMLRAYWKSSCWRPMRSDRDIRLSMRRHYARPKNRLISWTPQMAMSVCTINQLTVFPKIQKKDNSNLCCWNTNSSNLKMNWTTRTHWSVKRKQQDNSSWIGSDARLTNQQPSITTLECCNKILDMQWLKISN